MAWSTHHDEWFHFPIVPVPGWPLPPVCLSLQSLWAMIQTHCKGKQNRNYLLFRSEYKQIHASASHQSTTGDFLLKESVKIVWWDNTSIRWLNFLHFWRKCSAQDPDLLSMTFPTIPLAHHNWHTQKRKESAGSTKMLQILILLSNPDIQEGKAKQG